MTNVEQNLERRIVFHGSGPSREDSCDVILSVHVRLISSCWFGTKTPVRHDSISLSVRFTYDTTRLIFRFRYGIRTIPHDWHFRILSITVDCRCKSRLTICKIYSCLSFLPLLCDLYQTFGTCMVQMVKRLELECQVHHIWVQNGTQIPKEISISSERNINFSRAPGELQQLT